MIGYVVVCSIPIFVIGLLLFIDYIVDKTYKGPTIDDYMKYYVLKTLIELDKEKDKIK